MSLKIGFLHDLLVRVNEIVQKFETPVIELSNFLTKAIELTTKLSRLIETAAVLTIFLPAISALLAELALGLERFKKILEGFNATVNEFEDFLQEFDISNILADAASNTSIVKGR